MAKTTIPVELSSTPGITDNSNATAITIDSSELVSIGNTSAGNMHSNANKLVVGTGSGDQGMSIYAGTSTGRYAFARAVGNNTDAYDGGMTYDGSRNLTFHTNAGSERMRIDGSGRVAIGVNNPADYYATNLVVQGASEGGITIASTSTSVWNYIMFADGTSGDARYRGYFGYNHSNDSLAIAAGGTQRLRVDSDGLKFGSDTAAANALDDYEEGTFTPTFGGATLSTDDGSYTKIGNQVTVHFRVITTGGLPTSSSQVQVGNLPFTIGTGFGGVGGLYVGPSNVSSATGGGGTIVPYVTGGETVIRFLNVDTGTFGYTTWGELEVSHNNAVTAVGTVTYTV